MRDRRFFEHAKYTIVHVVPRKHFFKILSSNPEANASELLDKILKNVDHEHMTERSLYKSGFLCFQYW